MAYATVSDLKTYLDIEGSGDDTLLADLIDRAQRIFEQKTGRTFEAASDTERTLDALADVDGPLLWLNADLAQVGTVTNGDGAEVAAAEYVTEPRNATPYYALRLLSSGGKSWTYSTDPENAISVTGRWAYSVTVPHDVAHAVIRLAGWLYRQRDSGKEYDRAIIAGNSTILPATFPSDVLDVARTYKRVI